MRYIVKDKELILKFMPGKGSWTYLLEIPDTKDIKGNWGSIKVSGFIDNYPIESKNLLPLKGQDKILSINNTIRKAINKSGGEPVIVTLYIHESADQMSEKVGKCYRKYTGRTFCSKIWSNSATFGFNFI